MEIIRGTTPTIQFSFETIEPSNIVTAYLIIKQDSSVIIEKSISDSSVVEDKLSFTLTQEETLSLGKSKAYVSLDWVTNGGVRGRSKVVPFTVSDSGKDEVL